MPHSGISCHKARLVQNMAFSNQPCGGRPVWPGQPFLAARKKHKKIGTLRVTWPLAMSRLDKIDIRVGGTCEIQSRWRSSKVCRHKLLLDDLYGYGYWALADGARRDLLNEGSDNLV